MEQAIAAVSGGNGQSKTLESAGLFKMTGAASDKMKAANTQSGKDEEDSNALVPFLQLLKQQISRTNKSSDDQASNVDGRSLSRQLATSLIQGDVTLQELQQALASLTQSGDSAEIDQAKNGLLGISFDALVEEMDLLKKNSAVGDVKDKDLLLAAVLKQTVMEEKGFDGGNKAIDAINAALDKELKEKSGNSENERTMNNNSMLLNQPYGMTLGQDGNKLFSEDKSSENASIKIAGMDLTSINSTKSDEAQTDSLNFPSQPKDQSAEKEVNLKIQGMEKQLVLKTDEKALQTEKMIFQKAQPSESAMGKITVNLTEVKDENKKGNDNGPIQSGKEDSAAGNNSGLTLQEMKESQIGKDNLRFAGEQYSNAAKAKAENKTQVDAMQAILGEITGKTKTEQEGKIISGEKGNEDISLIGVNAAGSGQTGAERTNDVSPGKIIGQITNEIKEAAVNEGGRVKMTLNPPSLGKLEMDVSVRNGKVEVVLVADNKDVQQTLNVHIDKLKGSLQNQGLTIDRCDVFMQDKREEYQQNFSQHAFYRDSRSGYDSDSRQENAEEEVKISQSISKRSGSVLRVSTDNISLFA